MLLSISAEKQKSKALHCIVSRKRNWILADGLPAPQNLFCTLNHLHQQNAMGLFLFALVTCIPDLDNKSRIHPPEHCQHCQRWLCSMDSALRPFPAPGKCPPPQATTQTPDKIQCAGSNTPPQTIGIQDPTRLEGLRQHWKHTLVQALPAPHDQSWKVLSPSAHHPSKSAVGAWSSAGFASLGFIWRGRGCPPAFPPINALFYKHIHSIQIPPSGISTCPYSESVNKRQLLVPQLSEAK